jgi:hypothetical protein
MTNQNVSQLEMPAPAAKPFDHCSACLSTNLVPVFEMKKLPQIGIYLNNFEDSWRYPTVDQGLIVCEDCGHIQLKYTVDPAFLYNASFTHRTSESPSASESNVAFANYVKRVAGDRRFQRVVEIGCNDTFLLQQLLEISKSAAGVDPIWRGREASFTAALTPEVAGRIDVVGGFVEDVDFKQALGGKPDLFVSSFVFEHIREPIDVVRAMLDVGSDDALYVIQVPGTDMLLDNCRFDQLSHQHYQQFTLHSFKRMIEKAGGVVVDYDVYYPVWGAIMMAFRKGPGESIACNFRQATPKLVAARKRRFDQQLELAQEAIRDVGSIPIYGLGAAQNFPTLAHFLGDVTFLEGIIDDNPARQDKYFPGIPVKTIPASVKTDYRQCAAFLTGPDYGRALIGRAKSLAFKQVITPFNVL